MALHLPTARKTTRATTSRIPAESTSVRMRSMVNRRLSLQLLSVREPLGKTFAQFAPQEARRGSGGFFDGRGQLDELTDIFFDVAGSGGVQLDALFKERRVGAEVDADVAVGLVGAFVEERAVAGDADQARLADPAGPGLA